METIRNFFKNMNIIFKLDLVLVCATIIIALFASVKIANKFRKIAYVFICTATIILFLRQENTYWYTLIPLCIIVYSVILSIFKVYIVLEFILYTVLTCLWSLIASHIYFRSRRKIQDDDDKFWEAHREGLTKKVKNSLIIIQFLDPDKPSGTNDPKIKEDCVRVNGDVYEKMLLSECVSEWIQLRFSNYSTRKRLVQTIMLETEKEPLDMNTELSTLERFLQRTSTQSSVHIWELKLQITLQPSEASTLWHCYVNINNRRKKKNNGFDNQAVLIPYNQTTDTLLQVFQRAKQRAKADELLTHIALAQQNFNVDDFNIYSIWNSAQGRWDLAQHYLQNTVQYADSAVNKIPGTPELRLVLLNPDRIQYQSGSILSHSAVSE